MKKILALTLVIVMTALLLAGCGAKSSKDAEKEQSEQADITETLKTIGDAVSLNGENTQYGAYSDVFVYAFELDGKFYRVRADLSEDVSEAIWALEYDEQHDEKLMKMVEDLPVSMVEDLSDQLLTEEERAALIGKTGQDLLDSGWYCNGHNLETMEFWMGYGPFLYTVIFDGKVAEEDWDSFVDEEDIGEMPIKSVEYMMLGDATDIME